MHEGETAYKYIPNIKMTYIIRVENKYLTLTPSQDLLAGILIGLTRLRIIHELDWNIATSPDMNILTPKQETDIIYPYYAGIIFDQQQIWKLHPISWRKFIEQNDVNFDKLKKYSVILPTIDNRQYRYGLYVNLYTFDKLDFLRGVISGIEWLNLDPCKLIFLLHEGETPLEFSV